MKSFIKKAVNWWIRIVVVITVLGIPALAIFDRLNPWPPAVEALSAYPNQSRICVGLGAETKWTESTTTSSIQRTFILFPRVFSSPSVIEIAATEGSPALVNESRFLFWFALTIYVTALTLCFRFFQKRKAAPKNASNDTDQK